MPRPGGSGSYQLDLRKAIRPVKIRIAAAQIDRAQEPLLRRTEDEGDIRPRGIAEIQPPGGNEYGGVFRDARRAVVADFVARKVEAQTGRRAWTAVGNLQLE